MNSNIEKVRRTSWFGQLINGLALIAGLLLCVLTAVICVDVASRYFRLFAMPWTLDIAEYLLYAITFLGAPWVLRDGGHIAIDLLTQRLGPENRKRVATLANAFGTIICLVLTIYACRVWLRSFSEGTLVYETFVFPEWILFSVAPPIFLILFVQFLQATLRRQEFGGSEGL
jgi:TRAP-type C4-dicarboxylate transport system permease small subunit